MSTLVEAFQRIAAIEPDAVALRAHGSDLEITWAEYAARVRSIAAGLAELGVGHGDTVALMLSNRPEFHLVDTAALHLGAVPFSMYNTSSPEQINYLMTNAESAVVVTEPQFLGQLQASGFAVKHVVCLDEQPDGAMSLESLEALGSAGFDFEAAWCQVHPDDVCTLIYTSGTTGNPKGVELTHGGLIAEVEAVDQVMGVEFGDRITSYLPSAHIADRLSGHYLQLARGIQITTVADPRVVGDAIAEVRPTIWVAVPRVWDKMRFKIEAALVEAHSPAKRLLGQGALALSLQRVKAHQKGERLDPVREALWTVADRVVLAKVRQTLGFDQLRWGLSGGAAIAPETLEFFMALGLDVCELWGMSETMGASTLNPPGRIKVGTVGPAVPGLEMRLAEDGEVLLRGPMIMKRYRKDPLRTAEVLSEDGWLSTGDVGTIDDDGYLTIIDRKKELIVSAAGKNMSPSNIENTIKTECPVAGSVVVIGDGRPYNVALIALDPDVASGVAGGPGTASELADHPAIRAALEAGVAAANARLSRVEQVKKYVVLPAFWEPGGDELTPTMKLKRRPIDTKYAAEIEKLYN